MEIDHENTSEFDSLGQFVAAVIRRSDIPTACSHSIRYLRETLLEQQFESDFKPERDQIDYIRSKQRSVRTKYSLSAWRDQVNGIEMSNETKQAEVLFNKKMEQYHAKKNWSSSESDEKEDADGGRANLQEQDQEPFEFIEESKDTDPLHPQGVTQRESKKDRKFREQSKLTFAQRCAQVGRVGPPQTELDKSSLFGQAQIKADCLTKHQFSSSQTNQPGLLLEIQAQSSWVSVRANTAVFSNVYYYEVQLLTSGIMQFGWSTLHCKFSSHDGVGDDNYSYAFDGARCKKWHGASEDWGEQWMAGDIIGTLIDLEHGEISFWRNQKFLGVAFKNVPRGPNYAYFPSITMEKDQHVVFNFGLRPFHTKLNFNQVAINEPTCLINNYFTASQKCLDLFKNFIMAFLDPKFATMSIDEKILVGGLILNHVIEFLDDPYIFEQSFSGFIYELSLINKKEMNIAVFQLFQLLFDKSKAIIPRLFSVFCRRAFNAKIDKAIRYVTTTEPQVELQHLRVVLFLLSYEPFIPLITASETFMDDMQILFTIHLPTQTEMKQILEFSYHELLPNSYLNKQKFQQNQRDLAIAYQTQLQVYKKIANCFLNGIDDAEIQSNRFIEFVVAMTNKSKVASQGRYSDNVELPPMSSFSIQMAQSLTVLFHCLMNSEQGFFSMIQKYPLDKFPIWSFFVRDSPDFDQSFKNQERLGGTLQHVTNEFKPQIKQMQQLKSNNSQKNMFSLFKTIVNIFDCGMMDLFKILQQTLDKLYIRHREYEELLQDSQTRDVVLEELTELVEDLHEYRLVFLTQGVKDALLRFSTWIAALLNHIDNQANNLNESLVYCLPNIVIDIPFEVFRVLKRSNQDLYDTKSDLQTQVYSGCLAGTTYQAQVVRFTGQHFFDTKIANPDLKETMIIRLNMVLQYQECINLLEKDSIANANLLQNILMCLEDKRWITHSVKNFLRLNKGKGFREIIFKGSKGESQPNLDENGLCLDITYSSVFLERLGKWLIKLDDPICLNFLNSVFNSLNEVTSELFMVLKEEPNLAHHVQLIRRSRFYLDLIVDLTRILETVSVWCPNVFISKEQIHANRLIDFILFVLKSVFKSDLALSINQFCQLSPTRTRSLPQILTPFVGILTNLYQKMKQCPEDTTIDSLEAFIKRTESFDISVFYSLLNSVLELKDFTEKDLLVIKQFKDMLIEADQITQQSMVDVQIDEEKLCPICCSRESNCVFQPCEHTCCKTCIQTHMQNNKRCPFCNKEIEKLT